jgi:protein-L-isoaspartate(D-aspartate) O-methyltransferase
MVDWSKQCPVEKYRLNVVGVLLVLAALAGLTACSQAASPGQVTVAVTGASPTVVAASPAVAASEEASYTAARISMVKHQIEARDVSDPVVLQAMNTVPRHEFVPADYRDQAYEDHPLPIGHGQTISQPYIVALMTELADIQPGERVLEIGTGSGYQAAILAQLTGEVYSIEIIPELAERAQAAFDTLGYDKITARQGDGYFGWEEHAPFDAILVTAAPDHVPQPLVNQLADGGRMVIPVGPPGGYQSLWLLERKGDEVIRYNWGGVQFVPLTREE